MAGDLVKAWDDQAGVFDGVGVVDPGAGPQPRHAVLCGARPSAALRCVRFVESCNNFGRSESRIGRGWVWIHVPVPG
eukprot:1636504-Prymnesium_polylepis.1